MKSNDITKAAARWIEGLTNVIFPNLCVACNRQLVSGEQVLCLDCLVSLPRTNFHRVTPNSLLDRIFSVNTPVERATSLFYYMRGNPYVSLIHETKYHGRPNVGRHMASMHAEELKGCGFFDGIDLIVPVPLHWFKKLRRGYNQAEEIASAISRSTGIPMALPLKASHHKSQTRKDAHARLKNALGTFSVSDPSTITGKNILLVDDVITTGATIVACLNAIKSASPSTRLNVYSLGVTKLD